MSNQLTQDFEQITHNLKNAITELMDNVAYKLSKEVDSIKGVDDISLSHLRDIEFEITSLCSETEKNISALVDEYVDDYLRYVSNVMDSDDIDVAESIASNPEIEQIVYRFIDDDVIQLAKLLKKL